MLFAKGRHFLLHLLEIALVLILQLLDCRNVRLALWIIEAEVFLLLLDLHREQAADLDVFDDLAG